MIIVENQVISGRDNLYNLYSFY